MQRLVAKLFADWKWSRSPRPRTSTRRVCLSVEHLEQRIVLDNSANYSPCIIASPTAPVQANKSFNITVECVYLNRPGNVIVPSYTGTMEVTTAPLTQSPSPTVLDEFPFSSGDPHTFTLSLPSSATIFVTDPAFGNFDNVAVTVQPSTTPNPPQLTVDNDNAAGLLGTGLLGTIGFSWTSVEPDNPDVRYDLALTNYLTGQQAYSRGDLTDTSATVFTSLLRPEHTGPWSSPLPTTSTCAATWCIVSPASWPASMTAP